MDGTALSLRLPLTGEEAQRLTPATHKPPGAAGGRHLRCSRPSWGALQSIHQKGAAAEVRLCAGYGALPVLPAGDAAHHRRHHAGRGHPEDPPASATVCRPTSYCRSPCPPGSLRLVLRLTAPGVSQTQPCWLAYGCHRALVCSWACNAPSPGPWVGRHGLLRARPVCHIPCRGRVLHGTRLHEALAMPMLAVPSCGPGSAPQQASACARAWSTVTACPPHGNRSQPCAPVFAAAGLSWLPAWGAARLAGGQPGGLPSRQP